MGREPLALPLDRVRRRGRRLTFEVNGNGSPVQELPFVIGVLADLSGSCPDPLPLRDRPFRAIDRDNFDEVFAAVSPRLAVGIEGHASEPLDLTFRHVDDFTPDRVARQVVWGGDPGAAAGGAFGGPLGAVLRQPEFRRLVATWRGLHYLVHQSETGTNLKIRVLNARKRDILRDLRGAIEFDQSVLFKRIHEDEYGRPDGEPYGLLVADYEFASSADELECLGQLAQIAAAAQAVLVGNAAPELLGLSRWAELATADGPGGATRPWDQLRSNSDWVRLRRRTESSHIALTLPWVPARSPDGDRLPSPPPGDRSAEAEGSTDRDGDPWMGAAWAFAALAADAFARDGWFLGVRGPAAQGWPMDPRAATPAIGPGAERAEETSPDRLAAELADLGFLALMYGPGSAAACPHTRSVWSGPPNYGPSVAGFVGMHRPDVRHLLSALRFATHLKVMAGYRLGSNYWCDPAEHLGPLQQWIDGYVRADPPGSYREWCDAPLAAARLEVRPARGKPGWHHLVCSLRFRPLPGDPATEFRLLVEIPRLEK